MKREELGRKFNEAGGRAALQAARQPGRRMIMSDCRRGTGAHCNCSEELVTLLASKLTIRELDRLCREHREVVLHSIAEARERKHRARLQSLSRAPRRKVG